MLSIFNYKTPKKFAETFKTFYADTNIKHIKFLSLIVFTITLITHIISYIYQGQIITIKILNQIHLLNYFKLFGSSIFFLLSSIMIKSHNWSEENKKNLTISFIIFVLLISLSTSYVVSSYNPKNTLTIFLTGVVTVSLFFVVEYKHIISTAIFISILYLLGLVIPKISFEDKLLNSIIGLVIGIFLISLSRYNYFYKSQNFIKIKELEEKNIEIEKLNKEKNDILNFVAHDLRSPLNNIEALVNLITKNEENENELHLLTEATKQAKGIINDLLEGAKSDPDYLLNNRLDLNHFLIPIEQKWISNSKREILFSNSLEKCFVKINASKLERVLDNLISNSIKFSNDDQAVKVELSKDHSNAILKIIDYGIGIPKELQSLLFNQFSKASREGLNGEKSTGLGLHITKKIIEENKGQLLVTSKVNMGTTFTVILPLV